MEPTTVRKIITDGVWLKLSEAIDQAKHSRAGKPPTQEERLFLEALLWLARTGSPWRDLPGELGHWHNVYMRYRRWEDRGVWARLWASLQTEELAEARALFIDSTTVRAHQHAAGAPKKTTRTKLWGVRAEV